MLLFLEEPKEAVYDIYNTCESNDDKKQRRKVKKEYQAGYLPAILCVFLVYQIQ